MEKKQSVVTTGTAQSEWLKQGKKSTKCTTSVLNECLLLTKE